MLNLTLSYNIYKMSLTKNDILTEYIISSVFLSGFAYVPLTLALSPSRPSFPRSWKPKRRSAASRVFQAYCTANISEWYRVLPSNLKSEYLLQTQRHALR